MKEADLLKQYLPENSVSDVLNWIVDKKIHFKITKSRKTKLGDYRPPMNHSNHRITINHNLNPYSFLITFIHELAHLLVYELYKGRVSPHGKEWKKIYRDLMNGFLEKDIFPAELALTLKNSIANSKASSNSDLKLSRALLKYDQPSQFSRLEELEYGTVFKTDNGRVFNKGERQRTRYKCQNVMNKRYYLFHPLTPVFPMDD
jgi:hypothetical protein